jgi:hypothetical protein
MTGFVVSVLFAPTVLAPVLLLLLLEHAAATSKPMRSRAAIRRVVLRGEADLGTVPPDCLMLEDEKNFISPALTGPHQVVTTGTSRFEGT